jgi:hypothetical protein
MKTTKKWDTRLLAGMSAIVLVFGLVLGGCHHDESCCPVTTTGTGEVYEHCVNHEYVGGVVLTTVCGEGSCNVKIAITNGQSSGGVCNCN